ncbi:PRC-barrel domain-containing protein [Erythrobacter sp. SG61-1L]|uniref:PRC-barrel domain-containing protein n=1 Tax=Erythrobacter sp. SG61-1L TaxID=1603897 RepID=UPI000A830651|nr:PRC-barrel domain-containing protein [Erythrobacter sp. SG61-1L]
MNQMTSETLMPDKAAGPGNSVSTEETHDLISSDKVDGTAVYSTDGEKLGHVDHLMIGKRSGQVKYAVMSFGGFLGLGESYHPIPWDALDYDTQRDGYVVAIDKAKLHDAPYYTGDSPPVFDANFGAGLYRYYGVFY